MDQLVGQYMAEVCDLGYLLERGHVVKTLRSIMKYNFQEQFRKVANHMRTFAINDEAGLLMASYPRGQRPARPFPYFTELMTGFEYTAAAHMLYEGLTEEGLRCYRAVRDRHDGRRRNPFNEPECGHHYARAMAAWAGILALTGFHYSAVKGRLRFAPRPGKYFWSTGQAWGVCAIKRRGKKYLLRLQVRRGEIKIRSVALAGRSELTLDRLCLLSAGQAAEWAL
ncbi:MAG: glycoside hydrolase family 116 protein [Planctomycetota bacterium]|nr:glycoside hydrolase family 116 protein [Planctomycetota bacterium]